MAIPTGQVTFTWDNMFQGIRPNKLVVAFVDSVAVAGTYSTNPFNSKNYELNRIGLYVDNIPIGGNPLRLNFDASSGQTILPAFSSMFEVMGKCMQDSGKLLWKIKHLVPIIILNYLKHVKRAGVNSEDQI